MKITFSCSVNPSYDEIKRHHFVKEVIKRRESSTALAPVSTVGDLYKATTTTTAMTNKPTTLIRPPFAVEIAGLWSILIKVIETGAFEAIPLRLDI